MLRPCTGTRWYVVVADVEGRFIADPPEAMARAKSTKTPELRSRPESLPGLLGVESHRATHPHN
jgi:hypothetical protein